MKLKDKTKTPTIGWKYYDPDLEIWIVGQSFKSLVNNVKLSRNLRKKQNHNFLEQMIEDQICDRLPLEECEGKRLGDVVHAIAKPIAKVIDRTLKTDLGGCGACAKRRAKLNQIT